MFRITAHDFVSADVVYLLGQNFLREEVDEGLDAVCHLGLVIVFVAFEQTAEVEVGVDHLEALKVKLMLEEDLDILDHLSLAETTPDLVSEDEDGLDDLVFIIFVTAVELVATVSVAGATLGLLLFGRHLNLNCEFKFKI